MPLRWWSEEIYQIVWNEGNLYEKLFFCVITKLNCKSLKMICFVEQCHGQNGVFGHSTWLLMSALNCSFVSRRRSVWVLVKRHKLYFENPHKSWKFNLFCNRSHFSTMSLQTFKIQLQNPPSEKRFFP